MVHMVLDRIVRKLHGPENSMTQTLIESFESLMVPRLDLFNALSGTNIIGRLYHLKVNRFVEVAVW